MLGLTMYNPPSHFFKASSACRKLPHHGVTVEVTAMLSQAASPEQLGGVGGWGGESWLRMWFFHSQNMH